ncbi:MAG: glycerol kinase GlpK [Verrucomicrobia bacterium]|nr:glycerol kinase GlpK [Verrucomicrobiota bacterium]
MFPVILSIDLGTTGNRAIIFDRETNVVAASYREFKQIFPQPGWVEHDAAEIWASTRRVIAEAVQQVDPKRIVAIGLTNQRETVVAWNPKTGEPIHNAIVWQDRRTSARCAELKRAGIEKEIRDRTGLLADPYFSATKIEWLLQNVPGAKDAIFGTIDSWILWNLSGGKVHATDVSNASRTMLFNLETCDWDDRLLDLFGVSRSSLPEVHASSGEIAALDPELFGFSAPICGVVGDQQGSMFAQGCYEPGIVKNTYGTGLFMMMNTGAARPIEEGLLTTVAWKIGGAVEYAIEGSVFTGGAAIQWLRDQLGIVKSASETEALAASLASNEDVYFVPALTGLGAPHWDPEARGTIIGITRATRRAHLARAVLEAIAYQTRDLTDLMCRATGARLRKLQVDGGACANNFLMQFQSDVLDAPVERPKIIETTALGAAGLAGLAAGLWPNREEFMRHRRVERTFEPHMDSVERDRLFARWQNAVQRSRHWASDPAPGM